MNYTFDSIAGYEKEKAELKRLCEIFNSREKYEAKGAKMPKGIIFYGGAGTGKTLFAKVMASVCNLQIFKIDLGDVEDESEICKIIKHTFKKAAKCGEPAMIFFDEVDKVLPDYYEEYITDRSKTILTQLLTLIDGMDSSPNIVFVATCNYYNSLPETLTRPGRIDKKIGIGVPNYSSRVAILKMYAERTSCTFEMTMQELAKLAKNFSCAALETLVNECILQSDENGFVSRKLVYERIFEIKNEDIMRDRSSIDDAIRACRNIGAFVVAKTMNDGEYVLDLERDTACNDFFNGIFAQYLDDYSGGGACSDEEDDDYDDDCDDYEEDEEEDADDERMTFYSKADLLNAITVRLGGYAAEEVILHNVYDNMSVDLALVNYIILDMFSHGMFGLSLEFSKERNEDFPYRPERLEQLNDVFDKTVYECYEKAKAIIVKNEVLICQLIPILVSKQVLEKKDCEPILQELGGIQK